MRTYAKYCKRHNHLPPTVEQLEEQVREQEAVRMPKSPSAAVMARAWLEYQEHLELVEAGKHGPPGSTERLAMLTMYGELFRKLELAKADVRSKMARAGLDDMTAQREAAGYEAACLAMDGGIEAAMARLALIPAGGLLEVSE